MELVYAPEDGDEQRWPLDLGKLRVSECEAIERRTGMTYGAEFKQRLLEGGVTARRAMLWTLMRRTHPHLKYDDVDFADDEVRIEMSRDELAASIAALEDAGDAVPEEQRAAALAVMRTQLAELTADDDGPATPPESAGKASKPRTRRRTSDGSTPATG